MKPGYFASKTQRRKEYILSLCLGVLVAINSVAQAPLKKIKEFSTQEVKAVSLDRLGNLYLVSIQGSVKKYDTEGNFMSEFSNPGSTPVTILEPWNPLRVFVYSREQQQILLLDRFLTPLEKIAVDPSLAIEPGLASPTPNNNFWLLDKADFSIKKVNSKGTQVLQEITLKLVPGAKPEFTFLREYQNQLFLIDKLSGIEILSVLGKPIRSLPIKNLAHMGFLGPEIYYLENGKLKFFDFYSEEHREISVDPSAQFVLITDERMVVIKKLIVEIWEYRP